MKRLVFIGCLLAAGGCGEKRESKGGQEQATGETQQLFVNAAIRHQIPARFLLSVAFLESNLTPQRSSVKYQDQSHSLGIALGETAFGLSYSTLGLPEDKASEDLETQIDAYARLIKSKMMEKNITLSSNPNSIEEKFDWIWLLARIHRGGIDSRRNIQVVFALELMEMLNSGYTWQNLTTGEVIELHKESPPIQVENLPTHIQEKLKLFTGSSDIYSAQYFELTYQKPNGGENNPDHIEVIHCPFTLSACLEMQNNIEGSVRLDAHYIIPQDNSIIDKPLQVAQRGRALHLTDSQGSPRLVKDAIIVMLVGESGRYIEGVRIKAQPTWFTKYQLNQMGTIIRNLCPIMKEQNPSVEIETCVKPGQEGGVVFTHQGQSEVFQWADIPDYYEGIFWPYIENPDSHEGGLSIQFNAPNKIFRAEERIDLKLHFSKEVAKILIQQAERCPDQKLIWTVLEKRRVRSTTSANFGFTLYYQGPNGNGEQFLRALAYDIKGNLLGWALQDIVLTDYIDLPGPGADIADCQRNGG